MSEHQELLARIDQLIAAVHALAGTPVAAPVAAPVEKRTVEPTQGDEPKRRGRPRKNPAEPVIEVLEIDSVEDLAPVAAPVVAPVQVAPLPTFLIDQAPVPAPVGCPIKTPDDLRMFVMTAFTTKGADVASAALQGMGFMALGQIPVERYEDVWRALS
jgi:hypothetical protein